ncbi:hypothetical protein GCM10028815_08750 [Mariniluteicoccus flavus]
MVPVVVDAVVATLGSVRVGAGASLVVRVGSPRPVGGGAWRVGGRVVAGGRVVGAGRGGGTCVVGSDVVGAGALVVVVPPGGGTYRLGSGPGDSAYARGMEAQLNASPRGTAHASGNRMRVSVVVESLNIGGFRRMVSWTRSATRLLERMTGIEPA